MKEPTHILYSVHAYVLSAGKGPGKGSEDTHLRSRPCTCVSLSMCVCRVKAGEWLGPWVLCHTLEAVVRRMEPDSLNVHVHVVSQPGGAVPVLYTHR